MSRRLEDLRWDNSYARLPALFHHRVEPTSLPATVLAAFNPDAADLIDLDPAEAGRRELVDFLAGNIMLPGTDPVAALYAGHQFGVWVPQLGDGRAILLGEVVNRRHERWDLQLKGAGMTRFSRMGDGRAVLRSTIREYLGAEAMHGLGIPSTRSLAIVASDAPVYREQTETAAVLTRMAPTHVRFGSFQVFAAREQHAELRQLADYVIDLHFTHLLTLPAAERYAAWYREVVDRTARLMAHWTAVGFTHGVMNTDNMSILGITLDYGPFAWMDGYDRGFIPNHSDPAGRYAFDQQPRVGLWNCARLGEALQTLVTETEALAALESYRGTFEAEMDRLMRAKLGLLTEEEGDVMLVADLLGMLHDTRTDYTRFFRALSRYTPADDVRVRGGESEVRNEVANPARVDAWLARYTLRLLREHSNEVVRHERMLRANPCYVLRNWMAQEAIVQAQAGNFATIDELRRVLRAPFTEQSGAERYAAKPPQWASEIELSCSS